MKKQFGTIYIFKNKLNGKMYVGQTINWLERLSNHLRNKKLYIDKTIKKYSINNFEIFIFKDIPINLLDYFEVKLIKKLDTISPKGYNLTSGGNLNKIVSESTKLKQSEIRIGKYCGKNHPMFGKHRTEEQKKKQSKQMKGKFTKEKHPLSKKIICLNTLEIFDCIKNAQELYNIKHIDGVCRNERYSAGVNDKGEKLVWVYYEDYLQMTEQKIKERINKVQHRKVGKEHCNSKSVICLNTLEIFDTVTEASKKYNIATTTISKVCKNKIHYSGKDINGNKLHWMYYNEYLKLNQKEITIISNG